MGRGGEPSPSAVTGKAPALTLSRRSPRSTCPSDASGGLRLFLQNTCLLGPPCSTFPAKGTLCSHSPSEFQCPQHSPAGSLLPSPSKYSQVNLTTTVPPTPAACTPNTPKSVLPPGLSRASAHVSSLHLMAQGHIKFHTPKLGLSPSSPTAPMCCSLNDPQNC